MNLKTIKRSGKLETLSKTKIFVSIQKASNSVSEEKRLTVKDLKDIANSVVEKCIAIGQNPIEIDTVENFIEEQLFQHGASEIGRQYVKYRYEKERIRNNITITGKIMAKNVQNQNANVDEFSFGGRIGETASHVMREYALNNLLSKTSKENHENNEVYIHDLDHYAVR